MRRNASAALARCAWRSSFGPGGDASHAGPRHVAVVALESPAATELKGGAGGGLDARRVLIA